MEGFEHSSDVISFTFRKFIASCQMNRLEREEEKKVGSHENRAGKQVDVV